MTGPFPPELNPWRTPHFYRCPICAAMLLNKADVAVHGEFHRKVEGYITNPMVTITNQSLDRSFNEIMQNAEDRIPFSANDQEMRKRWLEGSWDAGEPEKETRRR